MPIWVGLAPGQLSSCLRLCRHRVHGSADPLDTGARTVPVSGRTHGLAAGAGGREAAAVGDARPLFERTKREQSETDRVELYTLLQ